MTHLELQARKLNLIQDIINTIDNEELMSRLEAAYKRSRNWLRQKTKDLVPIRLKK